MVFMYCPLRPIVALGVPAASDTLILEDVEDSRTRGFEDCGKDT